MLGDYRDEYSFLHEVRSMRFGYVSNRPRRETDLHPQEEQSQRTLQIEISSDRTPTTFDVVLDQLVEIDSELSELEELLPHLDDEEAKRFTDWTCPYWLIKWSISNGKIRLLIDADFYRDMVILDFVNAFWSHKS